MKVRVGSRRSVSAELQDHCHLGGTDDFIEVTEWINGEGHDVHIERKSSVDKFSLTHGEWELLQVLMNWRGETG